MRKLHELATKRRKIDKDIANSPDPFITGDTYISLPKRRGYIATPDENGYVNWEFPHDYSIIHSLELKAVDSQGDRVIPQRQISIFIDTDEYDRQRIIQGGDSYDEEDVSYVSIPMRLRCKVRGDDPVKIVLIVTP